MPLFLIACVSCGGVARRLGTSRAAALARPCKGCGGAVAAAPVGPSSTVVERLDNGAMARTLERLADAERLYKDRARAADPLAGTRHVPAAPDPKVD